MAIYKFEDLLAEKGVSAGSVQSVTSDIQTKNTPSFFDRIMGRQNERAEALASRIEGGQGFGSTALQLAGQVAAVGGDIIGEGINAVTGGTIPKAVEFGSKLVPDFIANAGADAVIGYENWKLQNPEAAANLESTATLAATLIPGKTVAGAARKVGSVALDAATGAAKSIGAAVAPVASTAANVTRGVTDAAVLASEGLARVPGRIATNVAEKAAVRESIKELPTKIARTAAQDGIAVEDIKRLYKVPVTQKGVVKQLAEAAQKYAAGDTAQNPLEIVGRPIVEKLKTLESLRASIGKKLGAVADNLGDVDNAELSASVFNKLQEVPGLSGLKNIGGKLDFTDTSLSSTLSASDQNVIQEAFDNALKATTGKQAHLYRQELFEILGGKKKSLANITDTQERAFNAIRDGISDVLETKNGAYKTLSSQYRSVVQPVTNMRKLLKAEGLDKDLLDLSASLLARRITSNAASNPLVRQILRQMDSVSAKGKTLPKIEVLQDVYNILDKYLDIQGGTTLQGQVSKAIGKSTNVKDVIGQSIADIAGATPAVQKKALGDMLSELFGTKL